MLAHQDDLFGDVPSSPPLPSGMALRDDFLTPAEEAGLLAMIASVPLENAVYKAYVARRRTAHFGSAYDFDDNRLLPAPPIPAWLEPLRERIAAWVGLPADAFTSALVSEYAPGTPLGWHRDVPDHEVVAGVSLGGMAWMRLRRWPPVAPRRAGVVGVDLAPRSAYVLRDEARWGWQHSVAPTPSLRHSITLRTRRERR